MSSYPAPDLLVSYLATAAHEVQEGLELSDRSRWAIRSAKEQLAWQHEAQVSARQEGARGAAALVAAAGGRSHLLAELIIDPDQIFPGAEGGTSTDQLAAVIRDLDRLVSDGPESQEAAGRLGSRLEAAAEELLASSSDFYVADDYKAALSA